MFKLEGFWYRGELVVPGQIPEETMNKIEEQAKVLEQQRGLFIFNRRVSESGQ